jgi:hypothetical protein
MTMAEAIHDTQAERRGNKRYRTPDGLFLVENADSRQRIGDLIDISADGLAFVYSAEVDEVQESGRLNVVAASGEVHLERIPYKNMNDFDYIRNYPFDAYRLRRRGVCFAGLTEAHISSLAVLIRALQ